MKNALNVLMVTPRYFPYLGGIETHVYEVGRRLVRNGVNVTLLTTIAHDFPVPLPREDIVEGMQVIRVQAWPRECDYYVAPEIYSIITSGIWDIIHCQGCHTGVPPLAMLAARKANIPYLVTFHTGVTTGILRRMQWLTLRPLLMHASMLIGVSNFEADYFHTLLHLPARRLVIIPNGADLPNQTNILPKVVARSLIISVGRLAPFKGHQHLITALPKIREKIADARLLILGTGSYEASLHALAQRVGVADHVEIRSIAGSDRQAMAELLSQAILVALLSKHESHPIAVLEALALQRPVLVTATSGLRELAEQGLVRAIPLHSTPEEIAQAALQQIMDPIVPPVSFALPTWDECANRLQAIYNACVENRKSYVP